MDTTDFSEDVIVDDVRYRNEAALIHALGGILVRINWPTKRFLSTHPSETDLDDFPLFDSVIDKDHDISLTDFRSVCYDHIALWTGALDEHRPEEVISRTPTAIVSYGTGIPLRRYTKDT